VAQRFPESGRNFQVALHSVGLLRVRRRVDKTIDEAVRARVRNFCGHRAVLPRQLRLLLASHWAGLAIDNSRLISRARAVRTCMVPVHSRRPRGGGSCLRRIGNMGRWGVPYSCCSLSALDPGEFCSFASIDRRTNYLGGASSHCYGRGCLAGSRHDSKASGIQRSNNRMRAGRQPNGIRADCQSGAGEPELFAVAAKRPPALPKRADTNALLPLGTPL